MLMREFLRALVLPAAVLLAGLAPAAAQVAAKPLWEVGLGVGVLSFPDYPGSDQQRSAILPTPYVVYRGEIFKAGRNGFQARLFNTERVDSYLSLSASPPVDSTDTVARNGMPDLKPTIQFGPAIELHLWQSALQRMRLDFRLPLRAVVSVAWRPRQVGWLLAPELNLDMADVAGLSGWNLGLQTGPVLADRGYNQTYYGVASADATATRPAYAASGGYTGSQFTLALSKRFPGFWVGGFARYDNLSGAVVADSPLMRRSQNLSAGLGVAWILGQSSSTVDRHE